MNRAEVIRFDDEGRWHYQAPGLEVVIPPPCRLRALERDIPEPGPRHDGKRFGEPGQAVAATRAALESFPSGLTSADIARVTGRSLKTVHSALHTLLDRSEITRTASNRPAGGISYVYRVKA